MSAPLDWQPFRLSALAYAFGGPLGTAVLRASPEDFQVEEDLGWVPTGEGEHVFFLIRKRNQNTGWVAGQLARAFGVRSADVAYAGLKDRRAVTTQWFSVHWPRPELPDLSAVWNEEIVLLAQTRNNRKLRPGAHQGNRFAITLRDVAADPVLIEARLARIAQNGVPNYFGEQRFGNGGENLPQGEQLLVERLAGGRRRRQEGRQDGILISALRSALFNRVVSERVRAGSWQAWLPGECLNLDGRGSIFVPEAGDPVIAERLRLLDIHPTGPLPGRGGVTIEGEAAALEAGVLAEASGIVEGLVALEVPAQRRALRLAARELAWEWPEPGMLVLRFALTSGSFATAVLRELVELTGSSAEAVPVE